MEVRPSHPSHAGDHVPLQVSNLLRLEMRPELTTTPVPLTSPTWEMPKQTI